MNTLFDDIGIYLKVEKEYSRMSDDRFLRDYGAPWRGMGDNWSAPDWIVQETHALERQAKQQKESVVMAVPGTSITIQRDEFSNVTLQGGSARAHIEIAGANWLDFVRVVLAIAQGAELPLVGAVPGTASAPVTNMLDKTDNPVLKSRMEANLREMEKVGQANYPKHR